jgi:hypothetical protein
MKKKIILVISALLTLTLCAALLTGCGKKSTKKAEPVRNPLTGSTDFDKSAKGVRPVALVVENTEDARPQWGMTSKKYSPDIILQGEVEGGITRTLWFYADYTKLPSKIGPMRSARPPYIKFSELFDAIFIHWGQSSSSSEYKGANTVFKEDKVDHINQMTYSGDVDLFSRDAERDVSSEHTGILNGENVADAIEEKGFDTKLSENATQLKFNKKVKKLSKKTCGKVTLTWSSHTYEDATWTYDQESGKYKTSDFENGLTRENLLILFDKTEYITKSNYHGTGQGVTYCDYKLAGGKAKLISNGTVKDIMWDVNDDNQLELYTLVENKDSKSDDDEDSEPEKKIVALNPGKTWIGWASSNNGGKVSIEELKEEDTSKSDDSESK